MLLPLYNTISAQEEIYRVELGGAAGGAFYLGDANYSSLYKNTQPMGGVVARYMFNPRIALKGTLSAMNIKGELPTDRYPQAGVSTFSNAIYDMSVQGEVNFWGYGIGQEYLNYKRFTPYISGGLGMTFNSSLFTMNIPIGIGVKYKLKPRWNIGLALTAHLTMSDKLDGINDPFRINSGFMKNKDSYFTTAFSVTYDLMPRCTNCNKLP